MSYSNGIISLPITASDPYNCLGVAKRTNGYDVGYICSNQHGKINMWSRYKPVHIANTTAVDRDSDWYKGTDGDCGIKVKHTTSYLLLPEMYESGESDWEYKPPQGGSFSPYRLADFDKYLHTATAPISRFTCPAEVAANSTFTCSLLMSTFVEEDEKKEASRLDLRDLNTSSIGIDGNLNDFYRGFVVTDTDGIVKGAAAGKYFLGSYTTDFPMYNTSGLTQGQTYYVYPFLSKTYKAQTGTAFLNTFVTIPNCNRGEIKVVSSEQLAGVNIGFTAKYIYNDIAHTVKSSITAELTITLDGATKTFNNNMIYFRFVTSADGSALLAGEGSQTIANFTVPAQGNYYNNFVFTIPAQYASSNYKVILSLNSGQYKRSIVPFAVAPDDPTITT